MAVVKNMMVRAGADFSAITKQASKASQSMRGMQNSVSRSCNAMSKAAAGLKKAFGALGVAVSLAALVNAAKDAAAAYDEQAQNEIRLAQVMRNTMNATNDEIQSILDLTSAQQQLGIVGDEVQLAGAQELATYLSTADALKELIPVLNDMAVQQYGYNVTAEETASIATMMGKVMEGQTGALSRYGYYFSEAEEHILKFGDEAQRAATLARIVEKSVGGMNQALASTPTGRMKQLSNTLGDIKEQFGQAVRTIGTVFLPLLNRVAQILAAVATLANKVAQTIANVFGGKAAGKEWKFVPQGTATAVSDTADSVDDLSDSTSNLTNNTQKAAKAAKELKDAYQQASFDTLNILKEQDEEEDDTDDYTSPSYISPSSAGSGDTGAGDMIQEIDTATEEAGESIGWLEEILQKAKAVWEDFVGSLDFSNLKEAFGKLKEAAKPLVEDIGKGLQWLYENVLKPLAGWTISELAPRLVEVLAGAFKFLHGVVVALQPALEALWPILKWLAEIAGFLITKALEELAHALSVLGDWMAGNLSPLEEFQVVMQLLAALSLGNFIGELISFANAAGTAAAAAATLGGAVGAGAASAGTGLAIAGGGGLIAALGSGAGAVSGFSLGITGTMVPALTAGAGATAAAGAGVAGLLGPIAAVIAIIAALGVAIYEVVKHWDEIKTAAAKAVDGMKSAWNGASEWFRANVSEPLIQWGQETWETIKKKGQEAGEKIKETWQNVRGFFRETWDGVRQFASEAFETAREKGVSAWNAIQTAWGRAKGFFDSSVFRPMVAAAQSGVQGVIGWFDKMLTKAREAVAGVREAVSNIGEGWSKIKESAQSFGSTLLDKLSTSKLVQTLSNIKIPHLAAGAVIPPNREFAAVLGDQTSGMNIETPEKLLREIVREESGSSSVMMMLSDILDAILDGKEITLDGYRVGRTLRRYQAMAARANG